MGIQSEIVPWLALALSVLAVVFAVKAILDWRDWRLTPLAIGLALMCSGPLLEIASREGRIGDDRYHLVTGYRGMLIALFSIAAVAALRRLMERERGLRLAAERSDQLARVNVELETELDQRRKAERALADAEARLRAILDNTPANIFIKDLEGRYLYRNDPRVLHEESAFVPDFVGKTDADLFPSHVAAELRASDRQAVESGRACETEHTIADARGARTYLTIKFPLRDSEGRIYAVAGVSSDITERAAAASAVRRVFELSPAIMCTLDVRGRFLMVNPAFARLLGRPESEIIGRSYEQFVHPDDRAATLEHGLRLRSGEVDSVDYENRYRGGDGLYRVLSWHTTFVADEAVFYAAATDVTAKAAHTEAIRRIYRMAPIAMCTYDWDGVIKAVNPVLPRILGFSEEEMVGRPYFDFVHPDDRALVLLADGEMHAAERTLAGFETRVLCKDGSYRVLSWDATSQPSERVFYGVARDVTEIRMSEQKLAKRRDQIAHELRLQTVGELASELSHELNQPLGAIANYASGLVTRMRAGTIATPEAVGVMEKVAQQAMRGGDLVRKVLLFARRGALEAEETCINDVVRDTIDLLDIGRHSATVIQTDLDEQLPSTAIDRSQIQQVLFNLLRNALDATEGRGNARLRIRTALLPSSEILVSVSDSGPGIPQADSERIFDAFYTTRPGGVGLGLPISRSIVQAHDGRLWMESTPGTGTTFYVSLPCTSSARPDSAIRARS